MTQLLRQLEFVVPSQLRYGDMASAARSFLDVPSQQLIGGTSEVLNCATATCRILIAGGVRILRRSSLAPTHPLYSERYRGGVRATQMGLDAGLDQELSFQPLTLPLAQPDMHRSLYVYQQVFVEHDNSLVESISAPDLASPHDYVEHVLAIWWEGGAPKVFDVRSQRNRILRYQDYLDEEASMPHIKSFLVSLRNGEAAETL